VKFGDMTNKLAIYTLGKDEINAICDECIFYLSHYGVRIDHPDALKPISKKSSHKVLIM
jgi:hypothetical protein